MSYIQIILPTAVAEEFADSVGREGCIQFTDLNEDVQPFQRPYTKDIVRIQEIERRVKDIENQLKEYKVVFDSQMTPSELCTHRRHATVDTIQVAYFAKKKCSFFFFFFLVAYAWCRKGFEKAMDRTTGEKKRGEKKKGL
ncbi:hypothetical protein RFI_04284 [Reticulomyxa filosa]|uniref:V-type proton ATPase subunit a n=1 Tax=Reticulomyxa filosa TaxID=46433 RepID=X6P418_RETFI|nr:hypothetical protein RFI_04284 [Reticulomyxa filosa]|eukprot:ETO32834.1 hypothetical protein RFI_04284 [Reticulomyxa filosa]